METVIYKIINVYDNIESTENLDAYLGLLDCIQSLHRGVVGEAIKYDTNTGRTDITDLMLKRLLRASEAMTDEDIDNVSRILKGTGKIKIIDKLKETQVLDKNHEPIYSSEGRTILAPEKHDGFFVETIANIFRLMRYSDGRHLINRLQESDQFVTIQPTSDFAAYYVDGGNPSAAAERSTQDYTLGTKSATTIKMPDSRFSKDSLGSPAKTKNGGNLISPAWLILAHELIHAKHNAFGKNRRNTQEWESKHRGKSSVKGKNMNKWTNLEEKWTIDRGRVSENSLRAQAGLASKRYGHHLKSNLRVRNV